MVKRIGNLYEKVCAVDNIALAVKNSRKGKSHLTQVMQVDADPGQCIMQVRDLLVSKTYRSGEYRELHITDPKERTVYDTDYFPHRIVHWALIQVIRPYLMDSIGPHSFGAMKGRGPHQALTLLDRYLRDEDRTQYCLKTDVRKYFPSIPKDRLMAKLERRFKDPDIIWLCSEIIHGYKGDGLPIGNYTSQYFANFFFHDIYHHLKHVFHCQYIIGYMDDWIVLGSTKAWLRRVKARLVQLLGCNGLELKTNWQIFPVSNGIPFLGYVTYRTHRRVRRRIKANLRRACRCISERVKDQGGDLTANMMCVLASYHGILSWCDGRGLERSTIYRIVPEGTWT